MIQALGFITRNWF